MWLDWIVEEGKNLFAEMILWLEKFAPLDERMPEEFGKRDWDRQESISDT